MTGEYRGFQHVKLGTVIIGIVGAFATLAMVTLFFVSESLEKSYELEKLKEEMAVVSEHLGSVQESFNQIHAVSHNLDAMTQERVAQASQTTAEIADKLTQKLDDATLEEKHDIVELLGSPEEDLTLLDRFEDLRENSENLARKFHSLATVLNYNDTILKSIPSITPAKGWISSTFGPRISPFTGERVLHNGVDIGARSGSRVLASAAGRVIFAGYSESFGKTVIVNHGLGIITKYAHNSKLLVVKGQKVSRGEPISVVGSTGRSTGPHLHYEIIIDGKQVDPMHFLLDLPHDRMTLADLQGDSANALGGETAINDTLFKAKKPNPFLFPIKLAMLSVAFALICLIAPAIRLRKALPNGAMLSVQVQAQAVGNQEASSRLPS